MITKNLKTLALESGMTQDEFELELRAYYGVYISNILNDYEPGAVINHCVDFGTHVVTIECKKEINDNRVLN